MANKLELTWVGKDKEIKIEPRILIEKPDLSNTDRDIDTENMLIHGDNLLALKALESKFAGKIKCIYIDPPYNTGSAFEQYDDNLEHSIWLGLMKPRLEILRNLLTEDGSLWISIDDDEQAYLKVLCDEIFGRANFVCNVIWEKKYSPQGNAQWLSDSHDFIMVYAKNKEGWSPNLLARTAEMDSRYKNPDNDPRGPWKPVDGTISLTGGQRGAQYARTGVSENIYELTTPSGRKLYPAQGRCWYYTQEKMQEAIADNRIWFGADGNNVPSVKKFLTEVKQGSVCKTIWFRDEVGDNQEAKKEAKALNSESTFATPKPERLIERVLTLGSNEGDLVLDSFLGSGTTAAVAHKMGRRYIGIEMGDHAYTHCKVRLDKVVAGADKGGITKSQNWKGGGGYRFYELAPTLIVEDRLGNPIINKEYNADMLAAAVALHEGFEYSPDDSYYWKQGKNENAYIFTTTAHVTASVLAAIEAEMQDGEFLVVACKSFDDGLERQFKNIKVKKIPQMLLDRCEFGKDNYNLNIIDVPTADDDE